MKGIGKYGLSFLLFIFFASCSISEKGEPALIGDFEICQQPGCKLSELLTDSFRIVPLETNDESLVGEIAKIKKHDNTYYVLSAQTLLRFDANGRFISKLKRQGEGPEEYIRIEDFDVYTIDGRTEIWVSDNKTLKIYDAEDMSFLRHISFDFLIYKFKRLDSSHILLVTGNREKTLTLTDTNGEIITDYLDKEFPFLMFRPVQFISWGENLCYQLGVSNAIVQRPSNFRKRNW